MGGSLRGEVTSGGGDVGHTTTTFYLFLFLFVEARPSLSKNQAQATNQASKPEGDEDDYEEGTTSKTVNRGPNDEHARVL